MTEMLTSDPQPCSSMAQATIRACLAHLGYTTCSLQTLSLQTLSLQTYSLQVVLSLLAQYFSRHTFNALIKALKSHRL